LRKLPETIARPHRHPAFLAHTPGLIDSWGSRGRPEVHFRCRFSMGGKGGQCGTSCNHSAMPVSRSPREGAAVRVAVRPPRRARATRCVTCVERIGRCSIVQLSAPAFEEPALLRLLAWDSASRVRLGAGGGPYSAPSVEARCSSKASTSPIPGRASGICDAQRNARRRASA
jgi:hypothetical protein